MQKGILFIPIDYRDKKPDVLFDEIIDQCNIVENFKFQEAFFGEHITDKYEKIMSSLMMVSSIAMITKKIKLGTLTSNLNFHKPAVISAMISQADHLSKGRLILGIGSGANMSDVEAADLLDKENHKLMLENFKIISEIYNFSKDEPIDIKSANYTLSTRKTFNKELGLGYLNKLYNDRNNLEIVMPALNKNSYNVKICAENNWSIAISNFCSDEIIKNHIENYISYSNLSKKDALKKIKLTKLIYACENDTIAEKNLCSEKSPYLHVVDTIYKKLKTFNKHSCFGDNVKSPAEALKKIAFYGSSEKIKEQINEYQTKYGELSSIIYVSVPKTNNEIFDNSLNIFSKNV